jgi:hypothetical protein
MSHEALLALSAAGVGVKPQLQQQYQQYNATCAMTRVSLKVGRKMAGCSG